MVAGGWTNTAIADVPGIRLTCITRWLTSHGIYRTRGRCGTMRDTDARHLRRLGQSFRSIARHLGVTAKTVIQVAWDVPIEPHLATWRSEAAIDPDAWQPPRRAPKPMRRYPRTPEARRAARAEMGGCCGRV